MELSDDTRAVLDYLNGLVEGGLRKRNDIGTILELGATHNEADLVNELIRSGTATWKVYSTLRRVNPGDQGYRQLEEEFALQMNTLREQLASLARHADDATLQRFDDVYFGMTQGVIRNIVDLGHDLARINEARRG
jgi:hypothetical protein